MVEKEYDKIIARKQNYGIKKNYFSAVKVFTIEPYTKCCGRKEISPPKLISASERQSEQLS